MLKHVAAFDNQDIFFCNKTTYIILQFWTGNDRRQDQCLFFLELRLHFNRTGNYSISIIGHRVFSCIPRNWTGRV